MPDQNHEPKDLLDWLGLRALPDFSKARWIGAGVSFMLTLLFLLALGAAVLVMVHAIGQAMNPKAEGPNLGAGALIAALLGAPFLIWATVIKQTTLNFQKEGHITDRISKAVEQLGAEKTVKVRGKDGDGKDITTEETKPNIEVRIGAILSLERIAQDSTRYDKGRDHVRVMEILCAYVRENAPASGAKNHDFGEWVPLKDDPTAEERAAHEEKRQERFGKGLVREWAESLPIPREDIAQALKVIGRRDKAQLRVEARWGKLASADAEWVFDRECPSLPDAGDAALTKAELDNYKSKLFAWKSEIESYAGYRPDLRNTNLQKADLAGNVLSGALLNGARIEGADLSGARMEGANLSEARLEGAVLVDARMGGADLSGARMVGADLVRARMEGAVLFEARMEGAHLSGAWMERAILSRARMERANLYGARMEGAILYEARLEGADLSLARMEGAFLSGARMEGASLCRARMEGADLFRARIEGANLSEARMEGANLSWVQMEGANLREAQMDAATKLDGATLKGAAMRFVDLRGVAIAQDQLNSVFSDASTDGKLPDGLTRPVHWPVWTLPDEGEHSIGTECAKWLADPAGYVPPPPPAGTEG